MAERVVAGLEGRVIALELLGLPAGAAVLEPDGDLAGLQAELLGEAGFPLRLQLVLHLEILLESAHLLRAQPPLLLSALHGAAVASAVDGVVLLIKPT